MPSAAQRTVHSMILRPERIVFVCVVCLSACQARPGGAANGRRGLTSESVPCHTQAREHTGNDARGGRWEQLPTMCTGYAVIPPWPSASTAQRQRSPAPAQLQRSRIPAQPSASAAQRQRRPAPAQRQRRKMPAQAQRSAGQRTAQASASAGQRSRSQRQHRSLCWPDAVLGCAEPT